MKLSDNSRILLIITLGVVICAFGIVGLHKATKYNDSLYATVYTENHEYKLNANSEFVIESTLVRFTYEGKNVRIPLSRVIKIEEGRRE